MDCIFCKIIKGEIPCYKLAENDNAIAFLDIMPVTKGHFLVIPKKHFEFAEDAPEELMAGLMVLAVKLAAAAKKVLKCDGINFIINSGKQAGQIIPHVHLHVVPRYVDDGIIWPWPQGEISAEAAAGLITSIKNEL